MALLNLNEILKEDTNLQEITDWTEVFASKYDFDQVEGWISEDEILIQTPEIKVNLTQREKLRE